MMQKKLDKKLRRASCEEYYSDEFFAELFTILNVEDNDLKSELKAEILDSARCYMYPYITQELSLPPNAIKSELKKAQTHIKKAEQSLAKVFESGNFDDELVNIFYDRIEGFYPSLLSILGEIRYMPLKFGINREDAPKNIIKLLSLFDESIELALERDSFRKLKKLDSLMRWLTSIAPILEKIIGRKLQQSRYYKTDKGGEYISKNEIADSELLKFIITPLNPDISISQIETAIKETHKERHAQKIS